MQVVLLGAPKVKHSGLEFMDACLEWTIVYAFKMKALAELIET